MSQFSLFDPAPCECGEVHKPHFLPNYEPPEWVIGMPPKCGENVYGKTEDEVLERYASREAGLM